MRAAHVGFQPTPLMETSVSWLDYYPELSFYDDQDFDLFNPYIIPQSKTPRQTSKVQSQSSMSVSQSQANEDDSGPSEKIINFTDQGTASDITDYLQT